MSYAMNTRDRAVHETAVPSTNLFSAVIGAVKNYIAHSRTVTELSSLSDRELADIGLTRSFIPEAVRGRVESFR